MILMICHSNSTNKKPFLKSLIRNDLFNILEVAVVAVVAAVVAVVVVVAANDLHPSSFIQLTLPCSVGLVCEGKFHQTLTQADLFFVP